MGDVGGCRRGADPRHGVMGQRLCPIRRRQFAGTAGVEVTGPGALVSVVAGGVGTVGGIEMSGSTSSGSNGWRGVPPPPTEDGPLLSTTWSAGRMRWMSRLQAFGELA